MKDLSHSIIVFISYLNPTYLESIMLTKQILFKETKKQKQFKNYIYKTGHFFTSFKPVEKLYSRK